MTTATADDLTLFLNDPTGRTAPTDQCDADVCTSLLDLINGATTTLDLAFYGFRSQTALYEAAVAARDRGVQVRLVVDLDVDGVNYYPSTPQWREAFDHQTDHAADTASAANRRDFDYTPRCERPLGFDGPLACLAVDLGESCYLTAQASREPIRFEGDIMHHKFAIADGARVWTGSTNASDSGTGGYNANLVMRVDSPTVARWYTGEFEQMFVHHRFHTHKETGEARRHWITADQVHVTSLFSPQDKPIERHLRPLLQAARQQIDVAVFFLTHKGVMADLIAAHQRGVKVRVILDASAATNEYTKHEVLRAAGIPVKIETWGGKMHAKSAVIDGSILIAGSMNWTGAGERGNDENTLIVRSREHAAQFGRWFDTLWAQIDDRWLQERPDPEGTTSSNACTDGVDNDHDHLADAADPGCSASPPPLAPLPPAEIVLKQGEACSWLLPRNTDR